MDILKNFIVLEGIDGSGTTTLLKNILHEYKNRELFITGTCEPTDLPIGKLIRSILRGEWEVEPETLAQLYSADRREHLYNTSKGIVALADLGPVISDRYFFSTLAYQSLKTPFETLWEMNKNYPLPEKLIFLDLPALTAQKRMAQRGEKPELFDELSLQEKIAVNYQKCLKMFADSPMKILRLDGSQSPGEIAREAIKFLLP